MRCERCETSNECCDKPTSFVNINGAKYGILRCKCSQFLGLQLSDQWYSLEHMLKRDSDINGMLPATSTEDKIAHYVLSQFIFNENENPEDCSQQIKFDIPDELDIVMLFWLKGAAIGFYTLKSKGTWIQETDEVYSMTTLDTIFIRKTHRRNNYCQEMLKHICKSYPNEDIGFSKPISYGMKAALQKFLLDNPDLRTRLWEIDGTGGEGNRKLIWFVLAKEQNLK